jgi:hypothetical protein
MAVQNVHLGLWLPVTKGSSRPKASGQHQQKLPLQPRSSLFVFPIDFLEMFARPKKHTIMDHEVERLHFTRNKLHH